MLPHKNLETNLYHHVNTVAFVLNHFELQTGLVNQSFDLNSQSSSFSAYIEHINYQGLPLDLLQDDDKARLVNKDGFFSIKCSANRITNYVINTCSNQLSMIEQSRLAIDCAYADVKAIWGDTLLVKKTFTEIHQILNNYVDSLKCCA